MRKEYSDEDFNRLWSVWPNKKSKWPAYQKFRTLMKNEPEEYEPLLNWAINQVHPKNKTYICMLKTIIHQRQWQDEEPKDYEIIKSASHQFECILDYVHKKGVQSKDPLNLSDRGLKALIAIGGRQSVGYATEKQLPIIKQKYIDKYITIA